MLTRQEVERLSNYRQEEFPIVSLYLNLAKGKPEESEHLIRLKNLFSKVEEERERWSKVQMESIERDLKKIEAFVHDEYVRGGKGLIALACSAADFWQTYSLDQRLVNRLHIDDHIHVKPLFRLLDSYKSYCTVLVDKGRARIFLSHPGGIEERSDVFGAVPGRHDQGGWAQARLQRHHDDRVMRHLKHTANETFALFQEEGFEGLLVGGTEELVSQFKECLHPYLRERLVATFAIELTAPLREVQEQTLAIARDLKESENSELIERLKSGVWSGKLGAAGLDDTLYVLQRGQVLTLLVNEDFKAEGYRCLQCGSLSAVAAEGCPYCTGKMEAIEDIVEKIVETTFAQGCEIRFISGDNQERLAELGGIGALLRY